MFDYFSTVENLSSHTSISNVDINGYSIIAINRNEIVFEVEGELDIELQWGSNSDVRRGDGITGKATTPYSMNIIVPLEYDELDNPFGEIKIDEESISVEDYERLTDVDL